MENTLLVIQYSTSPEGRLKLKNRIMMGITINMDFWEGSVAVILDCKKVVSCGTGPGTHSMDPLH
jgi:hypothetical protein